MNLGEPMEPRSVGELITSEDRLRRSNRSLAAEVDILREWRATVTAALRRPGGAHYADVPKHIRDLVREVESLRTRVQLLERPLRLDGGALDACRTCKCPRLGPGFDSTSGASVLICAECGEVHI